MIAQTVENTPKRKYRVRFSDGKFEVLTADTICKPDFDRRGSPKTPLLYTFKRDGVVVAEYRADDVSGWRIIDEDDRQD